MSFSALPRRAAPMTFVAATVLASGATAQTTAPTFDCGRFLAQAVQSSGASSQPEQAKTKQFYATLAFTEVFGEAPAQACPTANSLLGEVKGQGTAKLLGKTTLKAVNCGFSVGGVVYFASSNVNLIAANGDILRASYCGVSVPPNPYNPTFNNLSGTYVITGGTGRFEGATGRGTITGSEVLVLVPTLVPPYFAPALGRANVVLDGQIVY